VVNKRPPFEALRNTLIEQDFNKEFLLALSRWDYRVITVMIDKKIRRLIKQGKRMSYFSSEFKLR